MNDAPQLGTYDPRAIEEKWYRRWLRDGLLPRRARPPRAPPFSIVIPPPNVTGILHMGHALNNTLQDILVRWQRMQGYDALWLPGTDHAGIATQNVVERQLAEEGTHPRRPGPRGVRRAGLGVAGAVRRHASSTSSSAWAPPATGSRERFTMDEGLSRAVREVFVRLYDKGLIYRGNYIINWCPRCQTALSDEEVRARGARRATCGTSATRSRTAAGDARGGHHPAGDHAGRHRRGRAPRGRALPAPASARPSSCRCSAASIPVIADDFVDPEFGTGAVKVTPAHDPNDFEMGQRHGLPAGQRHRTRTAP